MSTPSTLLHLAVFSVGAAVGAGIVGGASYAAQRKNRVVAVPTAVPVSVAVSKGPSISFVQQSQIGGDVLKYGNPGPIADLLLRKAYVAGYDRVNKHPAWTAEHITSASLGRDPLPPGAPKPDTGDRKKSSFKEDEDLPEMFRARLTDYFRSGFDRGHMVPAADAKASQEAMDQTFLLSNMAPQVGAGFNRHYWAYLEEWCRSLTATFSDVYVFTIPLYLPKQDGDGKWRITHEVIGSPPQVSVPTHFAKVVLVSTPSSNSEILDQVALGAFVLPNAIIPDDVPLESFVVPVEAVEKASGLTLFSLALKNSPGTRALCQVAKCGLNVRRFDDAQKGQPKRIEGPGRATKS